MNVDVCAPQNESFGKAKLIYRLYCISCIFAFFVSVISTLCGEIKIPLPHFSTIIDFFSFLFVICVFIFERYYKFVKEKAEQKRRNGLFDNSFETRFEIKESDGYYDNNNIVVGGKRLLANIHENSFHTSEITQKMIKNNGRLLLSAIIILLICAYFGFQQNYIATVVLNVFLSSTLIGRIIDLYQLHKSCIRINDDVKNIVDTTVKREAKIFSLMLKYETTITTANIILSDEIYRENKEELKNEWLKIQKIYHSKDEIKNKSETTISFD